MKRRRPQAVPLHPEPHPALLSAAYLLVWALAIFGALELGSRL